MRGMVRTINIIKFLLPKYTHSITRFSTYNLVALPLNCPGMYRGVIRSDGVPLVAIFADEKLT